LQNSPAGKLGDWKEAQELIQAEHQEDRAQQEASDQNCKLHDFLHIMSKASYDKSGWAFSARPKLRL
jgi:hypothetical protein